MIRFSAALVVAAIGVLIWGVATSSLLLVYVAIGVSALALVVLAVGVALNRSELFGDEARSATPGTPERAGQSAGLQGAGLQGAEQELPSQAAGPQASLASGAGGYGSVFSRDDVAGRSPGADQPADASRFPGRPGAWPPAEPGFPSAPAAASEPSSGKTSRSRRPAAPPTRADPVLPWADTLPTRVDLFKNQSQDPVPSWLDDADGQPADVPAGSAGSKPADADEPAESGLPARATPAAQAAAAPVAAVTATLAKSSTAVGDTTAVADTVALRNVAASSPPDAAKDAQANGADGDDPRPAEGSADVGDSGSGDDDADAAALETAGTDADGGPSAPDPADLTDQAIEVPDPEPDALSSADPAPGDQPADGDGPPDSDGPADGDELADGDGAGLGRRLSGTEQATVVPGVPRYHVSDCILVRFMDDEDVQRMTVAEAEKAGCTPCGACQPED